MKTLKTGSRLLPILLVILLTAATGALAGDKVSVENGQVIIEDTSGERSIVLDTEGLGRLLGASLDEALAGMDEALAELEEMQLEIRLGDDNMVTLETEDESFEVDLDIIFREVGHALDTAFEDFDTAGFTGHYQRDAEASTEDLEQELKVLKKELLRLQKELDTAKEL